MIPIQDEPEGLGMLEAIILGGLPRHAFWSVNDRWCKPVYARPAAIAVTLYKVRPTPPKRVHTCAEVKDRRRRLIPFEIESASLPGKPEGSAAFT